MKSAGPVDQWKESFTGPLGVLVVVDHRTSVTREKCRSGGPVKGELYRSTGSVSGHGPSDQCDS